MLLDPSIDAVEICIPDHWHALVACAALAAGKHIWLQKPFAQTITEGRLIANLAKMRNRVVQVGSWQRSVEQFHRVCELVQNGRIGEIKQVEVGIGLDKSGGCSTPEPIPENLNYDMWLGPTDEKAPYNWTRVHQQDLKKIAARPGWIQMAPYGWGMITNWGAHHIDIAQWGLGKDDSGPDSVTGTCECMDEALGIVDGHLNENSIEVMWYAAMVRINRNQLQYGDGVDGRLLCEDVEMGIYFYEQFCRMAEAEPV